ncbi:purine-cytosine permease family protein [Neokomagataea thailandica]|uniref:Cytosine/purines/uracil/thiamine/allantoin transporter n=1 Tax=Neokomagataea tanensis NBRC 106556 TaxID=1223519 RepID=A0ABQ0QKY9_9PROT|nr:MULTISPECIES: cytosine permease [Neokomagataea]GBR48580.1 cytosine/purines/uracil/thiamine/allantoin transporter [Neokomagataea tanensis NBRC 106556]
MIEQSTIGQIDEGARYGRARDLFAIWFGTNMTLLTVVTGTLGPVVYHLSFALSVLAVCAGNLVGGVFMALHAAQGPALGVPQMIQSRGQFGSIGSIPIVLMVIIMYIGFVASNFVVGAGAVHYVMPSLQEWWAVVLMAVLAFIPCVIGYRVFHIFSAPLAVIATGAVAFCALQGVHQVGIAPLFKLSGNFSQFFQVFSLSVLWQIAYAPYVSDSSRYLPALPATYKKTFWACYSGSVAGSVLAMGLGSLLASMMPNMQAVSAIGHLCGALGGVVVLALTVSIALASAMDMYCSTLSTITLIQNVVPKWIPRGKARVLISLITLILALFMALFLSKSFLGFYASLLDVLMAVLVPWTAINLLDFYWLHRGKYNVADFFRADGGIYGRVNVVALMSYGVGLACEMPFLDVTFFHGFLAGRWVPFDISWGLALFGAAATYLCLARRFL